MESVVKPYVKSFWKNKRVFITGHTGFKGAWLSIWLNTLGAKVTGYALKPPTVPSIFNLCKLDDKIESIIGDVRDSVKLNKALALAKPDVVIHMAAQPLVRESYKNPVETYDINVMGLINLFEAVRKSKTVRSVVNVTTDKCYENREWPWGYRENEPMGGYDPYSNSKACSELVTSSYRNSFFNPKEYGESHNVALASARAGNVIGGGDWAADRLIPDCIKSLLKKKNILIRNPQAIRPWQHVLEPLSGYMLLAQRLYEKGCVYAEGWNFGPDDSDAKPVEWIVRMLCKKWGVAGTGYSIDRGKHPHEANYLKLDCSKSKNLLSWRPVWNLEYTIEKIVEWTKEYQQKKDVYTICLRQIEEYEAGSKEVKSC